ncbi:TraY domain-containing protein [Aliivibrio salmonicida]|uniref:TraY domain-containing protein n=1 Tax=Aliivibrio salmonicida TaxID=40269 RepID=UPI003D0E3A66
MTKKETISLNFEMDEETNRLLTVSAKKNDRSKRKEVAARIKHHVAEYSSTFERK